jgi:hypothetical protein
MENRRYKQKGNQRIQTIVKWILWLILWFIVGFVLARVI